MKTKYKDKNRKPAKYLQDEAVSQDKSCFEIKDAIGNTFYPIINEAIRFPNNHEVVNLQYQIPQPIANQLILIFKDPRSQSKSSQLLFLLT